MRLTDARAMATELERARRLVFEHGWNATSYQILNPGFRLWFAAEGDAVIGYVRHGRTRVVAGAPVCSDARLPAVAAAFENEAAARRELVLYFAAESRLWSVACRARPYASLFLGAQPVWRPERLLAVIAERASLRAQIHRARNKGVEAAEWPRARAQASASIRQCLDEWLRTRGLPALHFLVESHTLDGLLDRRVFVAERAGQPIAYLVATPIPARSGWLVEQIVRGFGACNGTSELLLQAVARAAAGAGASLITLGLAPLAQQGTPAGDRPPLRVRCLLAWARAHGRRFYDFRGLEAFKAKFRPDSWEPVYALATTPRVTLRTLSAIAGAFTRGSPAVFAVRALMRAVLRELQSLRRWRSSRKRAGPSGPVGAALRH